MKRIIHLIIALLFVTAGSHAQVAINKDGSTAVSNSTLQVKGNTLQKNILFEPAAGGGMGINIIAPTHTLHIYNAISGNTLRLEGPGVWGSKARINFGNGNYVFLKEDGDDSLYIHAADRIKLNSIHIAVNNYASEPEASALLDVKSTTKGFLPPRLNATQMNAIAAPAVGLMIYNITTKNIYLFDGTSWVKMYDNDGESAGTVSYEGKTYETVVIGDQVWMKENLNIGTMINSTTGGTNSDGEQSKNGTIEKYCYNNDEANCNIYGGLYQWDEMMQYGSMEEAQGICPPGWHIPTDAEWKTMEMYLGMSQAQADAIGFRGNDEGGELKETGTGHWASPNTGATNSSGFTGLPGGYRFTNGSFNNIKNYTHFWSSSENGTTAWDRSLSNNSKQVYRFNYDKAFGNSVRCIKNSSNGVFQMKEVEGGDFLLNSVNVTLSSFHMSKYEITNGQYIEFLNAIDCNADGSFNDPEYGNVEYIEMDDGDCAIGHNGSNFYFKGSIYAPSIDCPAIFITWYGANAYCQWAGGRLPTEAEWEVAARGGAIAQTAGTYNDQWAGTDVESQLTNYAWYFSNSNGKSHPVGTKTENELGLYDMSGNVWEWCSDWYGNTFPFGNNNPTGPASGSYRVDRGGSWRTGASYCEVALRDDVNPGFSFYSLGFRLVLP